MGEQKIEAEADQSVRMDFHHNVLQQTREVNKKVHMTATEAKEIF